MVFRQVQAALGRNTLRPVSCDWFFLGMAPADAGAGLAKTRPQTNPQGWEKPARM